MVFKCGLMVISILDSGTMTKLKEKVNTMLLRINIMMANGKKANEKAKGNGLALTELVLLVYGKMIC